MRKITYIEAIREAFDLALGRDSRVVLIGEGVPDPKNIFGSTVGLREKYGSRRVFDMPLAENGVTGICIGAAMTGLRPVMIHQRIDFSLLALDQIINNAAKWSYMFNGVVSIPLVIRVIVGRGWGQGPQHSQSLQAIFAQIHGLKVVMPTTAKDAKGMMLATIEDENPVIFIEHRWVHQIEDEVQEDYYTVPFGKARKIHDGSDVTIASFSFMSIETLKAGRVLDRHCGISADIFDMRSLSPLDIDSIIDSIKKTGKLILVDTASKFGSFSGELLSQVVERGFSYLKETPIRIAAPDHPAPTSHYMTENYYPEAVDIALRVIDVVNKDNCSDSILKTLRNKLKRDRPHDVPDLKFTGPF